MEGLENLAPKDIFMSEYDYGLYLYAVELAKELSKSNLVFIQEDYSGKTETEGNLIINESGNICFSTGGGFTAYIVELKDKQYTDKILNRFHHFVEIRKIVYNCETKVDIRRMFNCIEKVSESKSYQQNRKITIHYDFTDGTEISYGEGLFKDGSFTTHCLDFFDMDEVADDIIVIRKDGKKISRKNIQQHTSKEIREAHNLRKLLLGGCFEWK